MWAFWNSPLSSNPNLLTKPGFTTTTGTCPICAPQRSIPPLTPPGTSSKMWPAPASRRICLSRWPVLWLCWGRVVGPVGYRCPNAMPFIRSLRHRRYPFVAPENKNDLCAVGVTQAALQVTHMLEGSPLRGKKRVVCCCYKRVAPMMHKIGGAGCRSYCRYR